MEVQAVVFDFGGVLAEEGFQEGLYAIARRFGFEQEKFFRMAAEAVYDTGYVTGTGSEKKFWDSVREQACFTADDAALRAEIFNRFIPRPWMLEIVRRLRSAGRLTAILSDQSDWLDMLDKKYRFFREFDAVCNSYHLGKTKRDPTIFDDTVRTLKVAAGCTLFVDDNPGHIKRAAGKGLITHLYTAKAPFEVELKRLKLL